MPTCQQCQQTFEMREWDREFYKKISVPPPKKCPECRLVRRFMERNPKNAYHCFDSVALEDTAYSAKLSLRVKTSMDYNSWGNKAELMYQCCSCGDNAYNLKFCVNCQTNMTNCEYCEECFSSSDSFGCVGIKKQKFCIFNKKCSESGYHALKEKIIEHMKKTGEYGEFFPVALCPFGYNETMAMDAFPLSREMAFSKGYQWYEEDRGEAKPQNYEVPERYEVPESIEDVSDILTSALLTCDCGKNYKIIVKELAFYRKLQIPIPKKCPTCRHKDRMAKRNPLKLWQRNCAKCQTPIQTNYAPDRPETVYCEKCYLREVY